MKPVVQLFDIPTNLLGGDEPIVVLCGPVPTPVDQPWE